MRPPKKLLFVFPRYPSITCHYSVNSATGDEKRYKHEKTNYQR